MHLSEQSLLTSILRQIHYHINLYWQVELVQLDSHDSQFAMDLDDGM